MKNWQYEELVIDIKNDFYRFKYEEGRNNEGAAFRCFYEFDNVIKDGYTEKYVVYSTIGLLLAENNDVPQHRYEQISGVLNTFDASKIDDLSKEEAEKLVKQIEKVKAMFEVLNNEKKRDNGMEISL